jgi:hypothetical protein
MENLEAPIHSLIESNIFFFEDANGNHTPSVDLPALIDMFEKANARAFYAFGGGGGGGIGFTGTTKCCASGTCD